MGEKGCDQNSPGIGDIAYVKDLKTEKIVTRNFRCSKFGIAYHVGTKFGWVCINDFIIEVGPWKIVAFFVQLSNEKSY